MANESLLLRLTQLVDSYALRQKRASAVQSTFKLVTDAHNKALKALRDYAEHDTTVDVQGAQAAFARVHVREEAIDPLASDLRREIKTLAALIAALKESATALRAEPVDVVRLDKALAVLQESKEQPVLDAVPELQNELDLAQRALGDEFGQKLRTALAAQGVTVGGRSPPGTGWRQAPSYRWRQRSLESGDEPQTGPLRRRAPRQSSSSPFLLPRP